MTPSGWRQNGSREAQLGMAKIYKEGIGKPINTDMASEWTHLAAKTATAKSAIPAKVAAALWLSNGKSKSFSVRHFESEDSKATSRRPLWPISTGHRSAGSDLGVK